MTAAADGEEGEAFKLEFHMDDVGKANYVAKRLRGVFAEVAAILDSIEDDGSRIPDKVAFH
jgi:hypothetical protein